MMMTAVRRQHDMGRGFVSMDDDEDERQQQQQVYLRSGTGEDGSWPACEELDQEEGNDDDEDEDGNGTTSFHQQSRERLVAFVDELPSRARADMDRAMGGGGWSGLDTKIGDLDRRMTELVAAQSSSSSSSGAVHQQQQQQQQGMTGSAGFKLGFSNSNRGTGEGDESGEERRRGRSPPSPSFGASNVGRAQPEPSSPAVPSASSSPNTSTSTSTTSSTSSSSSSSSSTAAVAQVVLEEREEELGMAQDQYVVRHDEEEEETEDEDDEEDDGELVEMDEEEAERAEEVAEELAAFDAAAGRLLELLHNLREDDGQHEQQEQRVRYRYRRSKVVAVADGLRTLKQRVEEFAEPLEGFCPGQAAQLRLAVRSLSNAVVQLLNGLQAGTSTFVERKMEESQNLLGALRPVLVQLLLEACAEAEANQDLIRQATYLREAAQVGTETARMLKRAWEDMLDTSALAANVKQMIHLSVLAADKASGMREAHAKRIKRRCLRMGKACESLMRGVRQGVEVDDQFDKLVLSLSEWLAALNKAHEDIHLRR